MKTIKIKFWVYNKNMGDGSVASRFYKSEKEAKAASDKDLEEYGENYCDDVYPSEMIIDIETGEIVEGLDG